MPSCPLLMSPCHPQHLPQGHRPRLSEATRSHRALGAAQSSSPAPGCTFPLQSRHTDHPCQCPELPLDPRLAGGGSRGLPTAAGLFSPRVFSRNGSAAPHSQQQSWRSGILGLHQFHQSQQELQRNEGGWHTQAGALGTYSSIFPPVKMCLNGKGQVV